jgi:endothelin-converting enzyme
VADAGGVHAGYAAWKRHEAESPAELLPGLEFFTKKQLYFVASGRTKCDKMSGENMYWNMKATAHAPSPTRVKDSMENSA